MAELTLDEDMKLYIKNGNFYSSATTSELVIARVEDVLCSWVAQTLEQSGIPAKWPGRKALVKVFGGHSFGVISEGGDIDLVSIVPKGIKRDDFFQNFPLALQEEKEISQIRVIAAAYVPIIKFKYKETEVDMCLAVLNKSHISDNEDVLNDEILAGLDVQSIRSLSGVRENTCLMTLIPDNEKFCMCLKVIKHWAKCRGLHHYGLGFLGGIGWAILVAHVLQMFPDASLSALVKHFFCVYLEWQWPNPVLLRPLQKNDLNLDQWNPQISTSDGRHLMAVITPAYPEHNAAYTATPSTISIIQQELARGRTITENGTEIKEFVKLFEPLVIGKEYRHFLVVSAFACNIDDLADWSGLVESRLRILTKCLEKQETISLVHPHTSSYMPQDGPPNTRWLLGLVLSALPGARLSIADDVKLFRKTVEELARDRRLFKQGMTLDVQHVKRKNLPEHFPIS